MAFQNYTGTWLTQSNGAYDWLTSPGDAVSLSPTVDTVRIWQSYTLPDNVNNLVVFGDHNYAAGNNQDNVIQSVASGDAIYGGRGDDVFVGSGTGTTFIVAQGEGDKVIQNFTEGADTLRLIGGQLSDFAAVRAALSQRGDDVVLNDGGTMIDFRNTTVEQFQAKDFQLPLNNASLGGLTFNEEFDSPQTIGTTWSTNFGYAGTGLYSFTLPGNAEQEIYTSASFQGTSGAPLGVDPFSFNNGVLSISAQPVSDAQSSQMWGYHYSSGALVSTFSQTYGYFEMRAELPHGQGLWPAFWLSGANANEIDVLEGLGTDTKTANNAVHSLCVPALGNASFNPYADGFHNYGVLWDPSHITYYIDGSPVWQTVTPSDMNSPMHMIVNLAVGGNWPGSPDASTHFPAQLQVDYIHVYGLSVAGAAGGSIGSTSTTTETGRTSDTGRVSSGDFSSGGSSTGAEDHLFTAAYVGATVSGSSGADTLVASQGSDHLTGGAGADTFSFRALPWSAGHITDFTPGADILDLRTLFAAADYHGSDPAADGTLQFVADGAGGTMVRFQSAGSPWPTVITTLDHVEPYNLQASDWLFR